MWYIHLLLRVSLINPFFSKSSQQKSLTLRDCGKRRERKDAFRETDGQNNLQRRKDVESQRKTYMDG